MSALHQDAGAQKTASPLVFPDNIHIHTATQRAVCAGFIEHFFIYSRDTGTA